MNLGLYIRASLGVICLLCLLPCTSTAQMEKIEHFGANPGALNAYVYIPDSLPAQASVVVALHGCLQDAQTYATETGWNELADRYRFIVLYPEQTMANNPNRCFSWYQEGDINRDEGEALSIKNMVSYLQRTYDTQDTAYFVTGLSAGGAMTTVMLATYPELFAAGAVIAGIPYKATTNFEGAFPAMRGEVDQAPDQWSALVTEQNPHFEGTYPRLVIFHGEIDPVVNRQNMIELAEQWTHLHGVASAIGREDSQFDGNPNVTRRIYLDEGERPVVITYEVAELGHAQAVDPGQGPKQGGQIGEYAVDVDFSFTYWAAHFFGLIHD